MQLLVLAPELGEGGVGGNLGQGLVGSGVGCGSRVRYRYGAFYMVLGDGWGWWGRFGTVLGMGGGLLGMGEGCRIWVRRGKETTTSPGVMSLYPEP